MMAAGCRCPVSDRSSAPQICSDSGRKRAVETGARRSDRSHRTEEASRRQKVENILWRKSGQSGGERGLWEFLFFFFPFYYYSWYCILALPTRGRLPIGGLCRQAVA